MGKMLFVNIGKCTGCRLCEATCSMKHHGEFNPAKSRITVSSFPQLAIYIPVFCTQCEEAWCQRMCPTGAITKEQVNGSMIMKVSEAKCVGCKICVLACPFGDMNFIPDRRMVQKCDLCNGDPSCVAVCLAGALQFKEAEVATLHQKRVTAEHLMESHRRGG